MLARIAHELFWLGRDMTRAEHTARMLDGAFHADVADVPGRRGLALSWEAVLAAIGAKPPVPGEDEREPAHPPLEEVVGDAAPALEMLPLGRNQVSRLLTLDLESPASIVSCVARARERGRTLREVISTEMWEALNSFYLSLERIDLATSILTGPYSVYQEVKERCALFWGLSARTMLRDEGRSFLMAGGRIEEADMVLRMLRVAVPSEPPDVGYEGEALALLHAVGGLQAYRRAVRSAPTVEAVVRFLFYEGAYPGSVASSVQALRDALAMADVRSRSSAPVLRLGRLIAELELQRRIVTAHALPELLTGVQDELERVDRDISERYFAVAAIAAVHL
jgi:uncharacterized alpha-E superfamily protein